MASIKAILHTQYTGKDNTFPIVIRISHGGKRRLFPTTYKIKEEQWDEKEGLVKKHPDKHMINGVILDMISQASAYKMNCRRDGIAFNFNHIFKENASDGDFLAFLVAESHNYSLKGQQGTANRVDGFIVDLMKWKPAGINYTDLQDIEQFDHFLRQRKNSANTRFSKFNLLSTLYNKAIKIDKAPLPNPFKEYHISREPVDKTRLTIDEFEKLSTAPLTKRLSLFRDMFLFSYYCRGIRFENVLTIQKSDIRNGRVYYKAVKGGKLASTLISPKLQEIINYYNSTKGKYLFPLLKEKEETQKQFLVRKNTCNTMTNKGLKKIAKQISIREFSFHAARHSIATHLMQKGANASMIQEVLLHSSLSHTQKYIESLDDGFLDNLLENVYK